MESVCGLHGSQRGMPERQLPSTSDRPDYRRVSLAWDVVVPRCLLGISSYTHASARHGKNDLHHPAQAVLLQCDVVWLKEWWGNISKVSDQDVQAATRKNHGGLH